jgi:predicted outer membrane lipoprotein
MERKNHVKGRWNRLKEYLYIDIWLLAIVIALAFSKDRIINALTVEHFPIAQLSILLLFETLLLILIWIKAAFEELQMFQDYFVEFVPPFPKFTFRISSSIAFLLGVLCYFSYNIIIYSSIFVSLKLFEVWGLWIRDSKIRNVLKQARDETPPDDCRRNEWNIIEKYYLQRPQVPLVVTVSFFSFISVILGLLGELLSQSLTIWLLSSAYGIMLLNIIFAEVVYKNWRGKRDEALGE